MKNSTHDKTIWGFLIVAIAFIIFLVFNNNQSFLSENNATAPFVLLSALALGLLIVFFFLVSTRLDSHKKSSPSRRKRK